MDTTTINITLLLLLAGLLSLYWHIVQPVKYRRVYPRQQALREIAAYHEDIATGRRKYSAEHAVRLQCRLQNAPRVRKIRR